MNPSDGADGREASSMLHMETLQKNLRQVELVRIVLFIALGAICGICGFTGIDGFLLYTAMSVIITIAIATPMSFNTKAYMNETIFQLLISNMSGQFMSFVTFWALSYSLVYVY